MKHIAIRTGINSYRYTVQKLKSKLTPDAILMVTHDNYQELAERLKHRPMFSKYFLLEIHFESDSRFLEFITNCMHSSWIQCVIYASNKEGFEQLQQKFRREDIIFYDSYQTPDSILIKYIQQAVWDLSNKTIKLDKATATHIRNRVKFQDYLLDGKLELLVHTDFSKATINKMIPKYRGVKLATLPYHFFKAEKKREVAGFLVRYKNNIDTLYKPIVKFVGIWLELYEFYFTGELSSTNYIDWMAAHGVEYEIRYDYQIQRWLDLLAMYSYEKVLVIKMMLDEASEQSSYKKTLLLLNLLRSSNYEQTRHLLK